jgi:hypothetical protein
MQHLGHGMFVGFETGWWRAARKISRRGNRYCLSAGKSVAGVPAPHLSRRDRNRADLSSDKER